MKQNPKEEIKNVIEAAGGVNAVADLIGCSPITVCSWMTKGSFPKWPLIVEKTVRAKAAERQQIITE